MISSAMKHMMCVTVSTKRRPAPDANGKQAAPQPYLTSLKITPIDPLNLDEFHNIIERYGIKAPQRLRACYTQTTADLRMGDILVFDGKEYTIKGLGPWYGDPEYTYEIILSEKMDV